MASVVECSSCGSTIRTLKSRKEKQISIIAGWKKLGDAYYCKECISLKNRNLEDKKHDMLSEAVELNEVMT